MGLAGTDGCCSALQFCHKLACADRGATVARCNGCAWVAGACACAPGVWLRGEVVAAGAYGHMVFNFIAAVGMGTTCICAPLRTCVDSNSFDNEINTRMNQGYEWRACARTHTLGTK